MSLGKRIKDYFRRKQYERKNIYIHDCNLVPKDVLISPPAQIHSGTRVGNRVSIGRYTYIGDNCQIAEDVVIGDFCSIGNNINIGPGIHPLDWLSTSPFQYKSNDPVYNRNVAKIDFTFTKPVIIKNDVWIGYNAIIMGGLTIGNGVVIGAGAVVTKDIPDYAIVAGVPAKIIRFRFDDVTIQKLLISKWWEKDISELQNMPFNNVQNCLDKF